MRPKVRPHRLLTVNLGHALPGRAAGEVASKVVRAWLDTAIRLGWPGDAAALELDGLDHGPNNTNAVAQYGVQSFPTTILIGRDGKVIGSFDHRDPDSAVEAVKKLLKDGPAGARP